MFRLWVTLRAPVKVAAMELEHGLALWMVAVHHVFVDEALAAVAAHLVMDVNAAAVGLIHKPFGCFDTELTLWVKGSFKG